MMSLFSSFDSNFALFHLFTYVLFFFLIVSSMYKWSFINQLFEVSKIYLFTFFSSLKPKSFMQSSLYFYMIIFSFILILNLSSVSMYNFSFTSQCSIVLMFSFSIWCSMIMFQLLYNIKGFMSHCIPEGTPMILIWLLFLIELVSVSIRPVTLGVRLIANILAGHLLMTLVYNFCSSFSHLYFLHTFLSLVEIFVSLIQAYIFSTMCVLYYSDLG